MIKLLLSYFVDGIKRHLKNVGISYYVTALIPIILSIVLGITLIVAADGSLNKWIVAVAGLFFYGLITIISGLFGVVDFICDELHWAYTKAKIEHQQQNDKKKEEAEIAEAQLSYNTTIKELKTKKQFTIKR